MSAPKHLSALIEAWREGRGEGRDRRIRSWAEEVQWFEDYADGSGGTAGEHGVVAANWNDITHWNGNERVEVSDIPSRMCDLFERHGYSIEWCDQVSSCCGCYKCIQTETDCMSWTPAFMVGDGEILCQECIADDPEPWLEQCASEDAHWSLDNIDPADHGWTLAFEERDFVYADRLADELKREGLERGDWLFTQSRSYECNVYVRDDAWESYREVQAKREAEQKATSFSISTPCSEARYLEARECYEGFCPCCRDWTAEQCEPDATDRECTGGDCGRSWVVGAEVALLRGLIEITD